MPTLVIIFAVILPSVSKQCHPLTVHLELLAVWLYSCTQDTTVTSAAVSGPISPASQIRTLPTSHPCPVPICSNREGREGMEVGGEGYSDSTITTWPIANQLWQNQGCKEQTAWRSLLANIFDIASLVYEGTCIYAWLLILLHQSLFGSWLHADISLLNCIQFARKWIQFDCTASCGRNYLYLECSTVDIRTLHQEKPERFYLALVIAFST